MRKETPDSSTLHDLDQMRDGVDYFFKIKVRKWSGKMRPLTILEMEEISEHTSEAMQDLPEGKRTAMAEHLKFAKTLLEKATTSSPERFDPTLTEHMLNRMTDDEVDYVYKQYLANKKRCSPDIEKMSDEEILSLVADLKKSPEALIERSFLEILNVSRYLLTLHQQESQAVK